MIVAWLIGADAALAQGLRDAAGGRALLLQFATPQEAGLRGRSSQPDVLLYPAKGAQSPIEELQALAPGKPLAIITTSRDPLLEAAWLRAGVSAVLDTADIPGAAEHLLKLGGLSVPIPVRATALPELHAHAPQHAPENRSWEAALRCLARGWNPQAGPRSLAQLGVDLCVEALQATRAALLLPAQQGGLHVAAAINLPDDVRHAYVPAHGAGLALELTLQPRLLRAHDPAPERLLELFGAQLCAPLWSEAGFEGVIMAGPAASGQGYGASHEDLLLHLARLLGRALESARTQAREQEAQTIADWSLVEAPVGLVCLDADNRIEAMNKEAEELFGVQRGNMAGRHVQALHSELCDVALRCAAGEEFPGPLTIRRPGNGAPLEARLRRGEDERLLFAITPVPEARLTKQQAANTTLWEALATRMAQEIKNPLVAINTFAQLLPRKYDSADFRAAFSRVVQEEVDRINKVVDTLYQFAREPELKLQRLDLNTTVREVTTEFAKAVAERGIEIEHRLSETPLSAEIDPDAFRVVLNALMQNAADAMPEGGRVSITAKHAGAGVEIRVEDSGLGISGPDTRRVFDPFYSSKERGTGLGLAVAKKLAEAHEGTLELETSTAPGARFLLRFPSLAHAKHHDVD